MLQKNKHSSIFGGVFVPSQMIIRRKLQKKVGIIAAHLYKIQILINTSLNFVVSSLRGKPLFQGRCCKQKTFHNKKNFVSSKFLIN